MVTKLSDLPIRDSLKGKKPYGAPMDPVPVALNVNENTHPIEASVLEEITREIRDRLAEVNRYPDREAIKLRSLLAGYLQNGLSSDQVWAANGSNEILQQILQAFGGPGRSLLSFTPTYSMYPILASNTDTEWIDVARPEDFSLSPDFVSEAITKNQPSIVVLCGPNNPTGTRLSAETIIAAYDSFEGMLIVDEAYAEFDDKTPSAITLLEGRPRLIISRTMSKAFAFAGVRLGYMAADAAVIDALRLVRLPYHLSLLTQTAAEVAVKNADSMLRSVAEITAQRDRMSDELAELGYKIYDSGANFLLVGGFNSPEKTFEALLDQGILIRNLSIEGCLRLTAGTEAETTTLLEAIRALGPGGAQS